MFVDGSSLSAGLAGVQTQLCSGMAYGGSIASLVGGDGGLGDFILSAANGLLCSNSGIKLSDIPGMLDGSGSVGAMSTVRALSLMATVSPRRAGLGAPSSLPRGRASQCSSVASCGRMPLRGWIVTSPG